MEIKGLEFNPDGEWKWTIGGFTAGTVLGTGLTSFFVSAVIFGLPGSIIGWLLCFYDHNFAPEPE